MNIKQIAGSDHLPDYRLVYVEEKDQAIFYTRGVAGQQEQIREVLQGGQQRLI